MMNYLKTNFEQIRKEYGETIDALERAFRKFEIDFYLIGAQSKEVWTRHLHLKGSRTTRDIDFNIFIREYQEWKDLNEYLVTIEGFERDKKAPYRFYHQGEIIDLLPFGGIEKDGEVILDNPITELSVYGCKDVTDSATVIDGIFKVVTLPGLCIMKLIAYHEKPEMRTKDFDDFLFILGHYQEIAGEQLFEGNYDDLLEGDLDMQVASARMLGRHLKPILDKNNDMRRIILETVKNKFKSFSENEIEQMYKHNEESDKGVVTLKLLLEVNKGIED
jgi:predicted nucleotidyltransferase